MSYDLGIIYSKTPLTDAEAAQKYMDFFDRDDADITDTISAPIEAFVKELTSHYPQIDDEIEEKLDACPWSQAFEISADFICVSIAWSKSEAILPIVVALATKHGLVCFDPESETIIKSA